MPQRFHGRVFALNTLIAWSTLPLGFGGGRAARRGLLEPLLCPAARSPATVGAVHRHRRRARDRPALPRLRRRPSPLTGGRRRCGCRVLARFDDEVPDAPPDDLVGIETLERTHTS